jgi:hypothetical protein
MLRYLRITTLIGLLLVFLPTLALSQGCSGKTGPLTPDSRQSNPSLSGSETTAASLSGNAASQSSQYLNPQRKQWADSEVLIVFKDKISETKLGSATAAWPLQLIRAIHCRWATVYRMKITDSTSVPDMVSRLKSDPSIRFADPNYISQLAEAPYWPNDPLWEGSDAGSDPRDSIFDQWGPAKIGADLVWNESKGSSGVIVAIIDTGIRFDHEDLNSNLWINQDEIPDNGIDDDANGWIDDTWGWDCALNNNDPGDQGYWGTYHGSGCAGVVAAVQDNLIGCTGVAPGVKLMALRIDFPDAIYDSSVVEAVEYARVNGAAICSMSFGGPNFSDIQNAEFEDAYDNGNGLIPIAAAGNENSTTCRYPSQYDSVMCVGATIPFSVSGTPADEQRIISGDSLGYFWGSCYGETLDVMGFGERYITTDGAAANTYFDGAGDHFFNGTSCATPMCAGVMALIKSYFPEKNASWCWDRLCQTADDLYAVGKDTDSGYGRANALRAVYGSDRYSCLEDPDGFVPLELPDSKLFDSIHDVPDNPFYDTEDLYHVQASSDGYVAFTLDIYTWGEDLDIAVYSDKEMTQLVGDSTGANHAGSSYHELALPCTPGDDFYVKVYSPAPGNSTTYSLRTFLISNELYITGTSIAQDFIHQHGENVPFLKLTVHAGFQATLDELIINKEGTLPNYKLSMIHLYRDINENKHLDTDDELVSEAMPNGLNRAKLTNIGVNLDYHQAPTDFFVTADIATETNDCTVGLSLENYKDVITEEGLVPSYGQFPIVSGLLNVGTDSNPPVWVTTVGIQEAHSSFASARICWNKAEDAQTPPVKYNIYRSETLPFNIATAVKIANAIPAPGIGTDYQYLISNLPTGVPQNIVVCVEDQAGNEDQNLVVLSCTPSNSGDPGNPQILNSYPLSSSAAISVYGYIIAVARWSYGLTIFNRSDPVNLVELTSFNAASFTDVVLRDSIAYCIGPNGFYTVDLSTPDQPAMADTLEYSNPLGICKDGNWAYFGSYSGNEMTPIDIADPYSIIAHDPVSMNGSGYIYEIAATPQNMYVTYPGLGIETFNRTNPAAPVYAGTFGGDSEEGLLIGNGVLFSLDQDTGQITAYDIDANPVNPPVLGTTEGGDGYGGSDVVLMGNYAYIARSDRIVVYDVTDPSDMKYVSHLLISQLVGLATDGTVIYAISRFWFTGEGTLYVII